MSALTDIPGALQPYIDDNKLAGILTLVWGKDKVRHLSALGLRDREHNLPMERDTIFRIASMTKPITSVAALMLIEEGKLELNDPITKWAPEFADMRVLRDPSGAVDDTYPAPRAITIDDLMTHRSGLTYGFFGAAPINLAMNEVLGTPIDNPMAPDEWLGKLARFPLVCAPGERFCYGHSTDVLAFLIGRISGMPFADFLRTRLFAPLGMKHTGFELTEGQQARLASIYQYDSETKSLQLTPMPRRTAGLSYTSGGQGLYSTADDYLQFARLLLGKGKVDGVRLLKSQTVDLMLTNRLTPEQRKLGPFGTPWGGHGFGLGVAIVTDDGPLSPVLGAGARGAAGWPGAFFTWWQVNPRTDEILLFLVQSSLDTAKLARGLIAWPAVPALATFEKLAHAGR